MYMLNKHAKCSLLFNNRCYYKFFIYCNLEICDKRYFFIEGFNDKQTTNLFRCHSICYHVYCDCKLHNIYFDYLDIFNLTRVS